MTRDVRRGAQRGMESRDAGVRCSPPPAARRGGVLFLPQHLRRVDGVSPRGTLLEVCDCRVLCPCWIGEDPDYKTCDTIIAWHFDKGTVDGVDVTGRTAGAVRARAGQHPAGNWTAAVYLDDGASAAQEKALLAVYTGQKGGPVADLAKLVGTISSVQKVPITFTVDGGYGRSRSATPATPSSSRTRARRARPRR
jgi:hypothetical protein